MDQITVQNPNMQAWSWRTDLWRHKRSILAALQPSINNSSQKKKSSAYVQQHDRRSAGRIIEEIHQMSSQNYISRIGASKQRSITLYTSLLKCFSLIYAHDMFYLQWFFFLFICRSLLLFRDVLSQKGLPPSSKAIIHFVSILIHHISSCFAKCSTSSLSPDINTTPFYH